MQLTEDLKIVHMKANSQKLDSWIAMLNGEIIGHIYMDQEPNQRIKFLDAWVHRDHRRKGIYRALWDARWSYVQTHYPGYTVYAWCKPIVVLYMSLKGSKHWILLPTWKNLYDLKGRTY